MKTTVELDDDLVDAAAAELGTTTKKDTIHAALAFVVNRKQRRNVTISDFWGEDVSNPEVMQQARR